MTYTVHPLEDVAVAEANGEYYMTLAEAVEAVVSSSGKTGTVTLLNDAQGCGNILPPVSVSSRVSGLL